MKVLITGAAGFIGSHLCERLLTDGSMVVGLDNFDDFYDPRIKRRNIESCIRNKNFKLIEADIRDSAAMDKAVGSGVEIIVHLAAKAGVRPSIEKPLLYADVNINGTMVLLDSAKKHKVKNIKSTSSSSAQARASMATIKRFPFLKMTTLISQSRLTPQPKRPASLSATHIITFTAFP